VHFPDRDFPSISTSIMMAEKRPESRRRQSGFVYQLERARIAAGRDRSHVPDHAALCVEIGRADEQKAALGVFRRDVAPSCSQLTFFCSRRQRGALSVSASPSSPASIFARREDVRGSNAGVDVAQLLIVRRSEKRKWRGLARRC
jgi:hypothetical protein